MTHILVAGATGALGQQVVRSLRRRGHHVRALSRTAERGRLLEGAADEITVGDATRPESIAGALQGVDTVFSCLGQSVGMDARNRAPGYRAVDYAGNHNLIERARLDGVHRFVYVSVFGAEQYPKLEYMRAHADIGRELKGSGLSYGIIQPTGFFSALEALLDLAQSGRGMIFGDGSARSNPIHDADLAELCADVVSRAGDLEIAAGGPEVLSRRQMVELAFAALGKPPRISALPAWAPRAMSAMARPFAPRLSELLAFVGAIYTNDAIAPAVGMQQLGAYLSLRAIERGMVGGHPAKGQS